MISFSLSEEQSLFQSLFEKLAQDEVRPRAAAQDVDEALDPALLQIFHAAQLLSPMLESSQDAHLRNSLLLEELGWADASSAVAIGMALAYAGAIARFGNASQIAELADLLGQHEFRGGAVLFQEPGLAGDRRIAARAELCGGLYKLSGTKAYVPVIPGFNRFIVIARTDDGLGAFPIDLAMPGVTLRPGPKTLGLRALRMGTLLLDNVEIDAGVRLGGVDIQSLADDAALAFCAILAGLARAVMELVVPYTKERVVHGSALAQKQSVAFRLADMFIEIPAMRWMVWRGAVALDKGRCAAREALLARRYCAARATAIADEGIQLLGGHGFMRENPVERWFREARTVSLLGGN